MTTNKHIKRDGREATRIFDNRTLDTDYRHLGSLITAGMKVLDVGCGTGAISKDIAQLVGENGLVIGIDKTHEFIESGRASYRKVKNLQLVCADLFDYEPEIKFDLIVSARMLQWLSEPVQALRIMKSFLISGGNLSILDYNHEELEWNPAPPLSMQSFYQNFLQWRADAGMNNRMADELSGMLDESGFTDVQVINSDEHYHRGRSDFAAKVGIWSKVAGSTQMVEEGYVDDALRLKAVAEYDEWVATEAISMTMKLNEVRGKKKI